MLKKRAQGMSMNIIVVAAIALIILVVLIVIFVTRSGKFTAGVSACQGTCFDSEDKCTGEYKKIDYSAKCYVPGTQELDETNRYCCISVV